ncbi:TPA: deoxyhypusine synthase [Candidatus Woesearchaeota archaeon]|nr:deoxyhypusine synthase [Candidatus Woesearchaeota archaeon]HIH31877.1 deoxyhypusine synthase [Candidatus Woesearchaeota archaeon]HIH54372.1 deoxyhypusine synthase [Candidatus Woesearchaeota archaeon]HIJ01152.1 deoxyhypusine synthase [Candidatus Woesearchaeota archaeon]HIJ13575.1 deoxyhypusine synthase [Candidatus Woesearchaeota archaeon]
MNSDYQEQARFMRRYETLEGFPEIKGYDFDQEFNFHDFINSYKSMGIQGTNIGLGIDIIKKMIGDKAFIFLSCTSNMISSGNREIIRFLVKHKHVHALVMSAGAVEEDIIKCFKPFVLGSFDISGRALFDKGVGRIGNIFAPYDRYLYFEKFMNPFFDRIYEEMKNKVLSPSELIKELGKEIENNEKHEESIIYWAYKNDIPIFCPAMTDGSLGDLMHFQKQKRKDFIVDMVADHTKIVNLALNQEKTATIILGGGVSKHYILNANIFRDGLDYAVYITTAQEYDASDSGGNPQEAMTWAKLKVDAPNVKIRADASIVFPLIVAGVFGKN